ncbi:MAG TPA: amino acid adenylation domain-containing protein, partial [Candidatus Polarisedimenticolaceae bacterium]|nr:amino acid adenylation domain-containing protein [Candidatus Polarisedimenticolaceae bacterium]
MAGSTSSHILVKTTTLVEVLCRRSEQHPHRAAYVYLVDGEREEVQLTYAELARRARAVAARLQALGPAGERALLLVPPGLDYIVTFFGCLLAGVVAVPLYAPRLNRSLARIRGIAVDAGPLHVIATQESVARAGRILPEAPELAGRAWIAVDGIPAAEAEAWREPALDADSLALLQYTSGSTGTPRGVMVRHGNLLHNAHALAQRFEHDEDCRIVSWLPLHHDMGLIGNVVQALYAGIPCVLMSPMHFLERPRRWLEAISLHRATTSGGPNFAYDLCADKIGERERSGLDLRSWANAFNGAEPVRAETLERFATAFEPCGFRREAFYPSYGLAEATLFVSGRNRRELPVLQAVQPAALGRHRVVEPGGEAEARVLVGCGRTLEDQTLRIVHPTERRPCSAGEIGEIWISGPSVAAGYWNRPAESAEKFHALLDDGAAAPPFLRTGDLGFLQDGELFITGRLTDLIIVHGINHYPQDIERTVEHGHGAIRSGCTAAFSVESGGEERLAVAAEIRRDALRSDLREVAAALREAVIEEHEVAVHAVVLLAPGSIRKTTSGKIQRRSCRDDYLGGRLDGVLLHEVVGEGVVAKTRRPPRTAEETLLAGLWQQLLGASEVGLDDHFFRLGGDSLRAARLAADAGERLGIDVPPTLAFDAPLLGAMAARLRSIRAAPAPAQAGPAAGSDVPASFAQQRMWFLEQLDPGTPDYHIALDARILGPLDARALEHCLDAIVERHDSLRTVFPTVDGRVVPRVTPPAGRVLEILESRDGSVDEIERQEAIRPFDLAHGPLFRAALLRLGPELHVLLLVMHHIVSDGWSVGVMLDELRTRYEALRSGQVAPRGEPPRAYADYARRQRHELRGNRLESLLAHWRRRLSDIPDLVLPTDRPRPAVRSHRGGRYLVQLPPELAQRLDELGRRHGVTPFMMLLAAFQTLLYRWSGSADFGVGSPVANRDRPQTANLVGLLVNTLVLRADLAGNPTFLELLSRVRDVAVDAYAHQELPFERLVEELHPERSLGRQPLFQVMLVLRESLGIAAPAGLSWQVGEVDTGTSLFDLTLTVERSASGLTCCFEYDADLFDPATIERAAARWHVLLGSIGADPSRRVGQLELLPEVERRQVVELWSDGGAAAAGESCLHELVEAQAERTPSAVAVVSADEELNYAELERRANRVARRLRGMGVGPEVRVGLCVERSAELVVGMLGVLKAGGAYVPLDPRYPRERLAAMVNDAAPAVVLTQRGVEERVAASGSRLAYVTTAEGEDEPRVHGGAGPDNLAYIIYTSGSTGRPKGVMVSHRALCNRLLVGQAREPLGPEDRVLQNASVAFDTSLLEIFGPLIAGACVVVPGAEVSRDAQALASWIARYDVSVLEIVPTLLSVLVEEPRLADCRRLRRIVSGGEQLPVDLARRVLSRLPVSLLNTYGPTETTIDVTHEAAAPTAEMVTQPIGRPLGGVRLYVLDGRMEPVGVGVVGELYVGGVGLARGYVGQAGAT